jgi:hypothetical protein
MCAYTEQIGYRYHVDLSCFLQVPLFWDGKGGASVQISQRWDLERFVRIF